MASKKTSEPLDVERDDADSAPRSPPRRRTDDGTYPNVDEERAKVAERAAASRSALERYADQQSEWQRIRDELVEAGRIPTAYQVTLEQRKRLLERGERLVTADEIIAEEARG